MHGGKTPRGTDSPHFKHGLSRRYLPERYHEKYDASREAENPIDLREEIHTLDSRLFDLLESLDHGGSSAIWKRLYEQRKKALVATQNGDQEGANMALNAIMALIQRGEKEAETWNEYARLALIKKRLVDSERRRQIDMQRMMSADQVLNVIYTLIGIVRRHVHDETTLHSISTEAQILIGSGMGGGGDRD